MDDILKFLHDSVNEIVVGLTPTSQEFNINININKIVLLNTRRQSMNPIDFSNAAEAASFIAGTVGPYVAVKAADGFIKEIGKDAYSKIKEFWTHLKATFSNDSVLSNTLEVYESDPENEQNKAHLENCLKVCFQHHPEELTKFKSTLQELICLLPASESITSVSQNANNATDSTVTQIQGDGNTTINVN